MSALAQQHGAVNLGQGFPDFEGDPRLLDAVTEAMRAGHNQYPPMTGVAALREAVARKIETLYGRRYDPATEITITAGATQAILTAILALVHPGDEVIVLDPCYDSYEPNIVLAGAKPVHVPLDAGQLPSRLRAHRRPRSTPRTRAIIINSPHNPSGTVWRAEDMQQLTELLRPTDVIVISDEVYEHMVFDGAQHQSAARWPELAARSVIVSSFGKTYHVTGWKIGYVAAPAPLSAEFRKVHQFNVFTVNTPMQHALASYMADPRPVPRAARLLPAQARPVPRRPERQPAAAAAERRQLLPVRGLQRRQRPARGRILQLADARDRRGRDPAVCLLRRWRASSGWRVSASPRRTRRCARRSTGCPDCRHRQTDRRSAGSTAIWLRDACNHRPIHDLSGAGFGGLKSSSSWRSNDHAVSDAAADPGPEKPSGAASVRASGRGALAGDNSGSSSRPSVGSKCRSGSPASAGLVKPPAAVPAAAPCADAGSIIVERQQQVDAALRLVVLGQVARHRIQKQQLGVRRQVEGLAAVVALEQQGRELLHRSRRLSARRAAAGRRRSDRPRARGRGRCANPSRAQMAPKRRLKRSRIRS